MSTLNQELKPLFEFALKMLEFIVEHKDELAKVDTKKESFFEADNCRVCVINGLCDNITIYFSGYLKTYSGNPLIRSFFNISNGWISRWSKYSGQPGYPVPMPENFPLYWDDYSEPNLGMDEQPEDTKAYAAFQACDAVGYNMYADDYGQLRLQLAEFWAGKLKEKLNEINKPENNLEQQQ